MSNNHVLYTSDLQLEFENSHSTTQFVANEVVQYNVNNCSNVYMMQLDASQAFDCVSLLSSLAC